MPKKGDPHETKKAIAVVMEVYNIASPAFL